uniref:PHD finger protein 20-like protein 1 n=1 Tax=Cacopsylla melanoneura TaxID=428564 RepID=A0A8D8W1U2_9HEMI
MSIYPIGSYVEIDRGSVWKAALVKDADDPDDEILVHYLESGQEEWLCYTSSGIRKIDKPPDVVKPKPQPVKQTPPIIPDVDENPIVSKDVTEEVVAIDEEPQKETIATETVLLQSKYKVGDSVMAAWSKSKNFQARVEAVLPNNEYRVQFEDGLKKIVSEDQMTKEADIIPDPSCPKYTTRHKSIDFNSLQNASEEPTIHKKKKKKKDKIKKIKFSFPQMEKSKVSGGESKIEIVTQAEIHHAPDIDAGGDGDDEKVDVTGSSPTPEFDISQPVLIHRKDGTSQYTTPILDPKLPAGWYKHKAHSNGRWQGLLVNSDNKKFFGRKSLLKYFESNKLDYNPDLFDFSYIENPKKRRSVESNSEKKIKTLTPSAPSTPIPTTPPTPLFCDFNVSVSGNYVCPSENCKKEFRKEKLLMMHLKHYHDEFKNMLPPALNVADLAYARTNSMDDDETPKPVKKSSASFDATQSVKFSPPAQPVVKVHLEPPPPPAPCPPPTPETKLNHTSPMQSKQVDNKTMQPKLIDKRKESASIEIMDDDDSDEMEVDFEDQIALFEITKKSDELKSKPSTSATTSSSASSKPSSSAASSSSSGGPSSDKRKKDTTPEKKEPPKSDFTSPPSIKYEKMKKEEVVNCICGVLEEDGLMIQCDICLCWQHSHCSDFATESEVPEKYVCKICKKPPLQRKSFMYAYDQDWLNKGTLPTLDPSNKQYDEEFLQTQRILRETHAITGNLCKLSDSMHNSSIKVQIAQDPNHPKHYLWSQCVDAKDDSEEVVLMQRMIQGPCIPKPEAPIDSQECRLNLLTQVEADYDLMEQKLNELEAQICSVEADCSNLMGNPANDKPTLQMLIRDLETLRTLAIVN